MQTLILSFCCSASFRLSRLAILRNLRRRFLTIVTSSLHRRNAASDGCFGSTSNPSNSLSIFPLMKTNGLVIATLSFRLLSFFFLAGFRLLVLLKVYLCRTTIPFFYFSFFVFSRFPN